MALWLMIRTDITLLALWVTLRLQTMIYTHTRHKYLYRRKNFQIDSGIVSFYIFVVNPCVLNLKLSTLTIIKNHLVFKYFRYLILNCTFTITLKTNKNIITETKCKGSLIINCDLLQTTPINRDNTRLTEKTP